MRTASKRFFSFLLVAVMVLSAIPFGAFAADVEPQGETPAAAAPASEAPAAEAPAAEAPAAEAPAAEAPAAAPASDDQFESAPNEGAMGLATAVGYLNFYLLDESGATIATLENVKRIGEFLGNAPVKASFGLKNRTSTDINYDDYVWPATLNWVDGIDGVSGNPYEKNANLANVIDGSISDTYYAKLSTKRIVVQVYAEWKEKGTTKTIKIDDLDLALNEPLRTDASGKVYKLRDTEIHDFMTDAFGVATAAGAQNYRDYVKNNIEDQVVTVGSDTYDLTGYKWDGYWYVGNVKVGLTKFSKNVTVTAKLTKSRVNVSFNAEGGEDCTTYNRTINVNTAYGTLPVPRRTDYVFMGWFKDADAGATYVNNKLKLTDAENTQYYNTTPITEDIELHAVWVPAAKVELYIFNTKTTDHTAYAAKCWIPDIPLGAPITTNDVSKMVSTTYSGPFDLNGTGTDSWDRFVDQGSAIQYLPKKTEAGTYELAVYTATGTLKPVSPSNSGANVNPNAGSTTGTGTGNSSATYDPSNPKTGDLAATRLSVAAFALTFSVMGLAGAYMFSRKKNFGL